MELRARDYATGSPTGGIQEAINGLGGLGGRVVFDQNITLLDPVRLKSGVTLAGEGYVSLSGCPTTAIVAEGLTDVSVEDVSIANPARSGMSFDSCTGINVSKCQVMNYNMLNDDGHGGIVILRSQRFRVYDCELAKGNGNGIRCHDYQGHPSAYGWLEANHIEHTHGKSAEGMTVCASYCVVRGNIIYGAYTTGILTYASATLKGLIFENNLIGACSQQCGGSHPAIQLDCRTFEISGVTMTGNLAYDDQPSPTQSRLLLLAGSGTVSHLRGMGNTQYGCISQDQVEVATSLTLLDYQFN